MKFSLFIVAIALMGCSTHKGQRNIASDESGDFVVRTIQQEISNDYHEPGQGIQDYVFGTASSLHDLFAGQLLGESNSDITMPSPEMPEGLVGDLKLKRAFVYVQGKPSKNYIQRLMNGKKISGVSSIDKMQMSLNGVEILKYQKAKAGSGSQSEIFVIITEKLSETKKFLRDLYGIKSIHQMKSGLVVEFDDVVSSEKFRQVISSAEGIDKLAIKVIDQCSEVTCLDLSGEDVNLLPLGKDDLKFHATVKSKKVPEDVKVDGFVEFELKVQLDGI